MKHALVLSSALTLSLGAAAPALAQTPAPAATGQGPLVPAATQARPPVARDANPTEIIVTARRVQERLQDVPISIKVFNQQTLSNRNVVTASDLAQNTPSLTANTNFGNTNTSFAIRGFVQDIGTQPSVGAYFAEVVQPRAASNNLTVGDGYPPGTFFDLQNVQVLRGPQGTLFGLNTTGGAVLLTPQKPTSELGGYIETGYGNYDMKEVQAAANFPISDNVRLRIAVNHESRDGYEKNDTGIGPSNFDDVNYTAVRGSLVVDVTPEIENYSIFSYNNSDTNGDVQKVIGARCINNLGVTDLLTNNLLGQLACAQLKQEQAKGAGFYTVQSTLADPETRLNQWQGINTTTWQATDTLTVKNIISYAQLNEYLANPLFGTNFDLHGAFAAAPPGFFTPDFASVLPPTGGYNADQSTFTEELQFQGRVPDWHLTYQSGIYVELSDPLSPVGAQSPVLLDCKNGVPYNCTNLLGAGNVNYAVGRTRYQDEAVYSQATYSILSNLKLTGGARYTWDETTNSLQQISYGIDTTGGVGRTSFSQPLVLAPKCVSPYDPAYPNCTGYTHESTRAPTWLLQLDYNPIKDLLLYASYTRGYRAGGIQAQLPGQFSTFQAERVNTYEVGFKDTFGGALRGVLDVDGFYNSFGNQQIQIGFDPNTAQVQPNGTIAPATVTQAAGVVNIGASRIYGMEVDSSITPFRGFTATFDYTYINAVIAHIAPLSLPDTNPYVLTDIPKDGYHILLTPKNKFSLNGTYTLPLDPGIGKISFGATYNFTSSQISNYSDPSAISFNPVLGNGTVAHYSFPYLASLGTLKPRNILDLNLNWNSIMGSHFDFTFFATNVTQDKYYTIVPGLYASTGFETAELGEPAMYGARLRFRFGG